MKLFLGAIISVITISLLSIFLYKWLYPYYYWLEVQNISGENFQNIEIQDETVGLRISFPNLGDNCYTSYAPVRTRFNQLNVKWMQNGEQKYGLIQADPKMFTKIKGTGETFTIVFETERIDTFVKIPNRFDLTNPEYYPFQKGINKKTRTTIP